MTCFHCCQLLLLFGSCHKSPNPLTLFICLSLYLKRYFDGCIFVCCFLNFPSSKTIKLYFTLAWSAVHPGNFSQSWGLERSGWSFPQYSTLNAIWFVGHWAVKKLYLGTQQQYLIPNIMAQFLALSKPLSIRLDYFISIFMLNRHNIYGLYKWENCYLGDFQQWKKILMGLMVLAEIHLIFANIGNSYYIYLKPHVFHKSRIWGSGALLP